MIFSHDIAVIPKTDARNIEKWLNHKHNEGENLESFKFKFLV